MSDADFYQEHRDDPDEWGEPEDPSERVERRRLAAMVSVRLSPDESALLRAAAAARQTSLSAFIRQAALAALESATARSSFDATTLTVRNEQPTQASRHVRGTFRSSPEVPVTSVAS